MKSPRQIWESERADPLAWCSWIGGAIAVVLIMLMVQIVVWMNEPVGIENLAKSCHKPYTDPRCVRVEDVTTP